MSSERLVVPRVSPVSQVARELVINRKNDLFLEWVNCVAVRFREPTPDQFVTKNQFICVDIYMAFDPKKMYCFGHLRTIYPHNLAHTLVTQYRRWLQVRGNQFNVYWAWKNNRFFLWLSV